MDNDKAECRNAFTLNARSEGVRKKQTIPRLRLMSETFGKYLRRWKLTPDGDPIISRGSRLLPVRMEGTPAMLKVAIDTEEKLGGLLMTWWDGQGAAQVFAHEDDALLMERAEGTNSLVDMARWPAAATMKPAGSFAG